MNSTKDTTLTYNKNWTEEDVAYLKQWYGIHTTKQISEKLGRTETAVKTKIKRLKLQRSFEYNGEITVKGLGTALGVSPNTVMKWVVEKGLPHSKRVTLSKREYTLIVIEKFWEWAKENQSLFNFSRIEKDALPLEPEWVEEARKKDLKTIPRNFNKKWTEEEVAYLEKWYGKHTTKQIGKKLGRLETAVKSKIKKLNLQSSFEYNGEMTAHSLGNALGIDHKKVMRWVDGKGLPHSKRITLSKKEYTLIIVEEFWEWAKENQSLFDFSSIERNALPPEPEWVEEARKRDYQNKPRNNGRKWTQEEEELLWWYYYRDGRDQKEIAEMMNRSYKSIEHRLYAIKDKRIQAATKRKQLNAPSSLQVAK